MAEHLAGVEEALDRAIGRTGKAREALVRQQESLEATADAAEAHLVAVHGTLGERSEENRFELQSIMRITYAVFCQKKYTTYITTIHNITHQITRIHRNQR